MRQNLPPEAFRDEPGSPLHDLTKNNASVASEYGVNPDAIARMVADRDARRNPRKPPKT